MELVQIDAVDAERTTARIAGGREMPSAAVGDPPALRTREAALGGDPNRRPVACPRRQGACDEPFVVTGLAVVQAIGVRGVEEVDAGVERGVQHCDRAVVVSFVLGGEAHAADSDPLLHQI